ncbi:MAG TPA: DUF2298 domain-containing protein, partial [Chloroflexota bacterium]|nr:DUF2298 domain-containing protein [Chloroflexota bacterium]
AGYRQRSELLAFWREHRRLILFEEGLFWVAFLFDVYIRSLNPDLWHPSLGGEKPMDLAYFTAAAKSVTYPPYDPWFSGGYLNYYYFGQIIVGTLTRLSGVLPTTSYNIVVPLLFALTVVGAFTAAYALIHRTSGRPRSIELAGAVLASIMVCVLGNIGGFFQLMTEIFQQSPPSAGVRLPLIGPAIGLLTSVGAILVGKVHLTIPPDWYWSSTRALALLGLQGTGSINEFPYFTFLFADLHAHLIALPFTLLAIALAVNVVKSAAPRPADLSPSQKSVVKVYGDDDLGRVRWGLASRVAALVTMGLVVGALYPTNSWDYPTYLGLIGVALAIPWYLSGRRTSWGFAGVLVQFAVVVVLSQLLFRPFANSFQSFYSGVHLSDEKSDVRWYFVINGLFVVIMITYFGIEAWQRVRRAGPTRLVRLYLREWELLPRILQLQRVLVRSRADEGVMMAAYVSIGVLGLAAVCVATGMSLVGGLLVLLVAALALALRREQSAEECLMVFLFATGLAISIGTEIVAIDGDIGRMNTIFKFYEQIWVLFGIAGAVAVVRINQRLGLIGAPSVRGGISAVLIVFFVMAAVYPLVATSARVSQRFSTDIPPTLDGTAFMDRAVYADTDDVTHQTAQLHFATDKAMIQWIQDNISGTPTILEGNRPLYRWGSRIAIYTGLPTVIGWDWHQKQQRFGFQSQIDDRLADVKRMYDDPSTETTMSLIRKYDVSYIIDGELEVGFYPTARTKFDSMVGQYLTVAYDQSGVRIYQVK